MSPYTKRNQVNLTKHTIHQTRTLKYQKEINFCQIRLKCNG
jgi:hypothetical protein